MNGLKDNPVADLGQAMAALQADPIASGRYLLKAETRGPAFDPPAVTQAMRTAMLRMAVEEGAAWLYRTEQVITGSTRHERFDQLSTLEQDAYRVQARRMVMMLDGPALSRATSRAIQWSALSNDLLGEPEPVADLAKQVASDALAALPKQLGIVWGEAVRA